MTKQYPLILPIPYFNKTRTLYNKTGQIPSPTSPQQPSSSLPPLPPIRTNPNNTTLPSNQSLLGPQASPTSSLNGTDMTGGNMTGGNMTGGNMTGGNMTNKCFTGVIYSHSGYILPNNTTTKCHHF